MVFEVTVTICTYRATRELHGSEQLQWHAVSCTYCIGLLIMFQAHPLHTTATQKHGLINGRKYGAYTFFLHVSIQGDSELDSLMRIVALHGGYVASSSGSGPERGGACWLEDCICKILPNSILIRLVPSHEPWSKLCTGRLYKGDVEFLK